MTISKQQKIVLASGNAGKIKEIQALLTGHPIVPQSLFNAKPWRKWHSFVKLTAYRLHHE